MKARRRPLSSSIYHHSLRAQNWVTWIRSRQPMRRVAVTGVGVVAPGGRPREKFWEAITSGRTATGKITFFDPSGFRSQIAAECDFDPRAAGMSEQEIRRQDRYI